jgi:hypothetical protein
MNLDNAEQKNGPLFENLSELNDLTEGSRIQTRQGDVYEVKSLPPIIRAEGKDLQTYLLVRIDGADEAGTGGVVTEHFTHSLNWPMDAKVRRLP